MERKPTYRDLYPHLFSPITVRGHVIKNRVVASPHSGGPNLYRAGGDGFSNFTETAAQYFGALARGGAGIVHTGHLGVDPRFYLGSNREHFNFFSGGQTHEEILPVMHLMTDLIHAYGAKASIELNHGGHFCTPVSGNKLLGPCSLKLSNGFEVEAMDEEEMDRVANYFAEAAWIGKRGGFNIVNVHAGHNWLLGEFFSPIVNKRTDNYGGSVENRARFPMMVLDRIRQRIGNDMIIQIRFSAAELLEGGITMEDAVATVKLLEQYVDIVQCSAGKIHDNFTTGFMFPMQYMEHGCNTYLAKEMRKHVDIPVETVGGINDPKMAEKLVADGVADFVAMARSFIADPNWAEKARAGNAEDIRPCIRCLRCLNYARYPQTGSSVCTVNPRRVMPHLLPSSEIPFKPKKVVVIGGGPAGMQAAHELAAKGHEVTLFEKDEKLGGRLAFADHMVFKEDIKRYKEYLIAQVEKSDRVTIRLNTIATPEMVKSENPDAVIVAIGADSFVPEIPGAKSSNVIHAADVFGKEHELGDKIVVVGGGSVGCEMTVHLQTMGKTIDVIEMADELISDGKDMPLERFLTIYYMQHEFNIKNRSFIDVKEIDKVNIHLSTKCVEITEEGVWVQDENGEKKFITADTVIMATGFKENTAVRDSFNGTAFDVLTIGDCEKVGSILNTSSSGYYASLRI